MRKTTFTDHMQSVREAYKVEVKKIAEVTSSSEISAYRWANGTIVPPLVKQKIIAEYLGRPIEELFPQEEGKEVRDE